MLISVLIFAAVPIVGDAVRCLDCVGNDCFGEVCQGDYCYVGAYAPQWGTSLLGGRYTVKGCLSGTMLNNQIVSQCEAITDHQDSEYCVCDSDYCNGAKVSKRVDVSEVPLLTCVCNHSKCTGRACVGQMCTYVVNHRTMQYEQGCMNSSLPLLEKRFAGACMQPPLGGAMHHSVVSDLGDFIDTESCICTSDYCNERKPQITVPKHTECTQAVELTVMNISKSEESKCNGEFCFNTKTVSDLGVLETFEALGCVSFIEDSSLEDAFEVIGCANLVSGSLRVETCLTTNDTEAIERASAKKEKADARKAAGVKKITQTETRVRQSNLLAQRGEESDGDTKEHRWLGTDTSGLTFLLVLVQLLLIVLILIAVVCWHLGKRRGMNKLEYDAVAV